MPIHDWTKVNAGIFHAFHYGWIEEISRSLIAGILPPGFYALPEQHADGLVQRGRRSSPWHLLQEP